MTLVEMAEQVTERIGVTDDSTLGQAKKFLRRRYAMVYDSQLWSESLVAVSMTNTDEDEIIHVPPVLGKVLQIRYGASGSSRLLQPVNHQQIFQINPDALDEEGDRVAWTELSPSATWQPVASSNYFGIYSSSASDTTQQVTLRGYGDSFEYTFTLDLGGTGKVYQDVNGSYISGLDVVEVMSKPVTQGRISLYIGTSAFDVPTASTRVATLEHWQTVQRQPRLRLLRAKAADATTTESLLIYGKRNLAPLVDDYSAPQISQIDDVLIALATADMLERERQYGKAQLKVQEGNSLLANRMMQERNQSSIRSQIIPQTETYSEEGLMY